MQTRRRNQRRTQSGYHFSQGLSCLAIGIAMMMSSLAHAESPAIVLESVDTWLVRTGFATTVQYTAKVKNLSYDKEIGVVIGNPEKEKDTWEKTSSYTCTVTLPEAPIEESEDYETWECTGQIVGYIFEPKDYDVAAFYWNKETDEVYWDNNIGSDYNLAGPFSGKN